MTSSRSLRRWTTIAALFVLIGQILATGAPARAAIGSEALLQPTPLVLKDGRIANVSIHVLPFGNGEGELAGSVAARLAELTATVATDCFLTAQVIGHVSSREVADNETLAAHRLARSRADAVQASLIGGGLPAKAIASVWDWQFLVREPRATLWVFRLVQGEDCEGQPLDGNASALVADSDAGQTPAQVAPPREASSRQAAAPRAAEVAREAEARSGAEAPRAEEDGASGPDLAGVVGSAVAAEAAPQAEGSKAGQAPAARASRPQQAAAAGSDNAEEGAKQAASAGPARDAASAVVRPLPALSPSAPDEGRGAAGAGRAAGGKEMAAVEPTRATAGARSRDAAGGNATQDAAAAAAQQDPERQGKVEWGEDNVVITFATNSSYFPPGTARRLASLLGNMAEDKRYRVRLEVGVSGSDTVVGASTPEEARRYNRWLAERRMGRVREWLDEHAGDRQIEVEPTFQADDNSRRVVVRVASIG